MMCFQNLLVFLPAAEDFVQVNRGSIREADVSMELSLLADADCVAARRLDRGDPSSRVFKSNAIFWFAVDAFSSSQEDG